MYQPPVDLIFQGSFEAVSCDHTVCCCLLAHYVFQEVIKIATLETKSPRFAVVRKTNGSC